MNASSDLIKKVKDNLNKSDIKKGSSLCLAVSGGADSMAMLLIFYELKAEYEFTLTVHHVNHGIRGEEAKRDAIFVENICKEMDLPYVLTEVDAPSYGRAKGLSLEDAARELRYEVLLSGPGDLILTAHNQDDDIETFVFNLLRGSGLTGLSGIKPCRSLGHKLLFRPLLNISRREIEAFLSEKNRDFVTDSTNSDTAYSRNRIRKLSPEFYLINSRYKEHILSAAGLIGEARDFIESLAREELKLRLSPKGLDTTDFTKLNPFLAKEVIRLWLKKETKGSKDLGAVHIDALLALTELGTGKFLDLPGFRVVNNYGFLKVLPQGDLSKEVLCPELTIDSAALSSESPIFVSVPEGEISVRVFDCPKNPPIPRTLYTKWFDYDKINYPLTIRTFKEGDYFTIDKDLNKKAFNRYCIDEKIPLELRGRMPLICKGSHILWAVGGRISEAFKIEKGSQKVLEIVFTAKKE